MAAGPFSGPSRAGRRRSSSGASPTQYYGEGWPARFERSPAVIHLVRVQPSTGAAIASTTEQLGRAVRLAEDASQVVV
jgi:hypothetical protein